MQNSSRKSYKKGWRRPWIELLRSRAGDGLLKTSSKEQILQKNNIATQKENQVISPPQSNPQPNARRKNAKQYDAEKR